MKIRKQRTTHAPRTTSLSPLNVLLPLRAYRHVRHLDSWTSVGFPFAPYPDRSDVLASVTRHVDALAEAGALDSETGDVLDDEISDWLVQWQDTAVDDLENQQHVTRILLAASAEHLRKVEIIAAATESRRARAIEEYEDAWRRYTAEPSVLPMRNSSAELLEAQGTRRS